MNPQTFIGVDNGLKGAIAILDDSNLPLVEAMPVIMGVRKVYDETRIADILQYHGDGALVVIELAQAMRRGEHPQGTVSSFKIGVNYALVRGICVGLRLPYVTVAPRKWQKVMHAGVSAGDTKTASIIAAKRRFPGVSLLPTNKCRKDSDGMADALLIARWAQITHGGRNE